MIHQKDNMTFVGTIQDIGKPYADLYHDKKENGLFLFVRVSVPSASDAKYAAIAVTPNQIMEYMDSKKAIGDIFSSHPFRYAFIKNKKVNMEDCVHTSSDSTFPYNQPFDPRFCHDSVKLKVALKRMIKQ
ncbi:MAG: hypothetical protein HDS15_05285 [Bacteroides sp.]|nr:hypothetical protein [Bacteroides sp.]